MDHCLYLNHFLSESTPLYGNRGKIKIEKNSGIKEGGTSNSSFLSFPAHCGTHIDAPKHFDQKGKTLDMYPPSFWFSSEVHFINIHCELGELITISLIGEDKLNAIPIDCQFLIIKSGAEKWRTQSPNLYSESGPGLGLDFAKWIRANRSLKFLGMDFISASSFCSREVGRMVHRELLGSRVDQSTKPILLIEDMALEKVAFAPKAVWVVPLMYLGADGAPVSIIAHF